MTWGRDDPGFPPSPDPAAEAERYYAEQSANEPPEDCDGDCGSCRRCYEDARYEAMRAEQDGGEIEAAPVFEIEEDQLPW